MNKKTLAKIAVLTATVLSLIAILAAEAIVSGRSDGYVHSEVTDLPNCDTALVLGCSPVLSDGRENLFFRYRIEMAHELYRSGKIHTLIVSGDNHSVDYDESTAMKEALVELGVPQERIFCDYAGFSTLDSVVRAKEIFGQDEFVVVSQEFHNRRAVFIGRSKGLTIHGINAKEVVMRHSIKTKIREKLARVKTVLDIWVFGREPRFLGERIEIQNT
ncbi:SanA/YdcF family protein [Puniceicoccus vermicola]|nr:ElyC/SanA/YdcF family protein [Puniceicoccus vermicola]